MNEGFLITGGALDVKSGSGKNAGSILVDAGTTLAVSGDIKAVGTGDGANGGTIRLTAQSDNDVVFSGTGPTDIIADGGQNGTTGSGGQITISNSGIGNIVFQNQVILSAAAEGSNGGNAGQVSATTAGGFVFGGVGSKIKANGKGTTGVNNIKLESAGDLTFGSAAGEVELVVNGKSPGDQGGNVDLKTDGVITVVAGTLVKTTPGPNGTAGSIKAEGQQIVVHGTVDLNGRGSGAGGTLDLKATDNFILSGTITANGGNNGGKAGVINIHGIGTTSFSSGATITANATNNGKAGKISLSQTGTTTMALDESSLSTTGSCDNEGCGVITIESAGQLSLAKAVINADGNANAAGGEVTISGNGTEPIVLVEGTVTARGLDAQGGTIRITGAQIVMTGDVDEFGAYLEASALGSGSHRGGNIEITVTGATPIDLMGPGSATAANLLAKGALQGQGGFVSISKVAGHVPDGGHLDINNNIKVNGGSAIGVTDSDGTIKLNGVTCNQWKVDNGQGLPRTSWPLTHWDCLGAGDPSLSSQLVAFAASSKIHSDRQAELAGANVQIYTMRTVPDWNLFFNNSHPTTDITLGLSVYIPENSPENVSSVLIFDTGALNIYPIGTTVHELGHQLDVIWGRASKRGTWRAYQFADLQKDTSFLDSPDGGATKRPCEDVYQQTTCDFIHQNNPNYTNTEIFIKHKMGYDSLADANNDPDTFYAEGFARLFEHLQANEDDPDFEGALEFCPQMKGYMIQAIYNGIHP